MYIQKINFNTLTYKPTAQKNTTPVSNNQRDLSNYYYRPVFNNEINFKSAFCLSKTTINNIKNLQQSLQTLLTPMKKDFLSMKKGAVVDYFNQFYNLEYGKLAMATEPDFKFVFKDLTDSDLKGEQFSIRVVDLKKGEFDFGFFDEKNNLQRIKLKDNRFYSPEDTKTPLPYPISMVLENKFNDMLPIINNGIEKINNMLEIVFKNDKKGYSMFLARGIKKRFNAINEFLNNIEREKRYALKRSYPKFIPFPNKSALFFKENDKMFAEKFAFIPHRENEEKIYRIVKFDSKSNIQDAYLIDTDKGIYKNYCKRKIFNLKNISVTPKDDTKMTSAEINNTALIPTLEKYYFLLDEFAQYIHENWQKSAKILLKEAGSKDYLPYNMIKQSFIDRLKFILPDNQKEFHFIEPDGEEYLLRKIQTDGINMFEVSRNSEKGKVSVFLDCENYKILDIHTGNQLIRDKQGKIKHIPHSSDAFKIRSRVLQEFIEKAFQQKEFIKDEHLTNTMSKLNEEFTKISNDWSSTYKNKKTEARKLYGESFISSKGDTGGFRFAIPAQEYSIGLKPHQIGKERFMRLTVYNKDGDIIDNFLLENYSKIVDNYCAQGKFTKDAISRTPDRIIYKTDEQIKSTNIESYLNEYLTELKRFSEFFYGFMGKNTKMTT